jgi:tetratricopeptide (TPR) repeat protein/serine/threonine protein kinase
MSADLKRVKEIFLAAVEKSDPAERQAYLQEACGADEGLRRQVDALLCQHEQASGFLETPPADLAPSVASGPAGATACYPSLPSQPSEAVGKRLGPYKILEQLGEGGMGAVYLAEQEEPVRRRVALKIIKAGMDSAHVIARFEQERQALALMDHPNIAKVLDAGAASPTDAGGLVSAPVPFFVMELVKGLPITKFCDQQHLSPTERLALFIPVCQAVQHAHQKGVIHRDLKPSNVLVGVYDGQAIPKVIDFGVAKAIQQKPTEQTLFTQVGQIVGTLEYMAPEQAELTNLDIDTRADIYSLGVILYELLTGSPPFTSQQLRGAAFTEMLRMIREVEPAKPSTKLSSSDELPSIAANRHLDPRKLTNLVHGDLDWIAMKCLEKERGRRYETANGLAMDIQRYLADEPVAAGPPSMRYRLRKFVRRNRAALATAAVVAAALIVGTVVSSYEAVCATRAEGLATERLISEREARKALDEAREDKERQRTRINRELGDALVESVQLRQQIRAGGKGDKDRWARLREMSKRAETLAASELADPALGGQVQNLLVELKQEEADRRFVARMDELRLGNGSFDQGRLTIWGGGYRPDYEAAFADYGIPLSKLTVEEAARRIAASAVHEHLVAALDDWASFSTDKCKQLLPIAKAVYHDAWRRAYFDARIRGDHLALAQLARRPDALKQPPAMITMLAGRVLFTDKRVAIELLEQALARYPEDLWINRTLAQEGGGSADRIIGFRRAALAVRPDSPALHNELGGILVFSKRWTEAIPVFRRSLELQQDNRAAREGLARALAKSGQELDEAERLLSDSAIPLVRGNVPILLALARARSGEGDFAGAAAAYRKVVELDPQNRDAYLPLGQALHNRSDFDGAITAYRKAIDLGPHELAAFHALGQALLRRPNDTSTTDLAPYRKLVEVYPQEAWAHGQLGKSLANRGDFDGAIAAFRKALDLRPQQSGSRRSLAQCLDRKNDAKGAIVEYRKLLELSPTYPGAHLDLGRLLQRTQDLDGAIAAFRRDVELSQGAGPGNGDLGRALLEKRDFAGAIEPLRKAAQINPNSGLAHFNLGRALHGAGDFAGAMSAYRRSIELGTHVREVFYALGKALLREPNDRVAGQADTAVVPYRKALEVFPQEPWAHYSLGEALADQKDHEGAIAAFRKAIDLDSRFALAHRDLGHQLHAKADLDGAIREFRKAIEVDSKTSRLGLAQALRAKGDLDGAIAEYRKEIDLSSAYGPAHHELAGILRAKGDLDGVIAVYRHTMEVLPKEPSFPYGLGKALHEREDFEGAAAAYRKAIDLRYINQTFALYSLGKALLHEKEDSQRTAVAAWEKATEAYPKNPVAHLGLGDALRIKKEYDRAVAAYRQVIALAPKSGLGQRGLGQSLSAKGDAEGAIAAYRRAIELDPKNAPGVHMELALALRRTGNLDGAIAEYRETIKLQPTLTWARVQLGQLLNTKGDLDAALAEYRKTLEVDPKYVTAHQSLIDALQSKRNFDGAIAACRQALVALGPDHTEALSLKSKLARAHQAKGDHADAIRVYEEIRDKRVNELGPNHVATLSSMNNLAMAYSAAKQSERALPLMEETVRRHRANLRADDVAARRAIANLGAMYRAAGRLQEAIRLLEEVVDWARTQVPDLSIQFTLASSVLVDAYEQDGQFAKAEPLHRQSLARAQKQFGAADPRTASPLARVGLCLLRQGKYADAEPLLRDCLAIREKAAPDDWFTFDTKSMLGGSLLGQKKFADAEPLLLQGYEGMKQRASKVSPAAQPRLAEAIERLLRLYTERGQPDEAAKWRDELAATNRDAQKKGN